MSPLFEARRGINRGKRIPALMLNQHSACVVGTLSEQDVSHTLLRAKRHTCTLACVLAIAIATATPGMAIDSSKPLIGSAHAAWSVQDGLPSGLVWALAQDGDGYIWVGTDTGLVRFDGVRFVSADDPALATGSIRALLSTDDGSLWVGTSDGLVVRLGPGIDQRFGAKDGTPLSVGTFFEDAHHQLWAGGRGGLAVFTAGQWHPLGADVGLSRDVVTGIYEDADQTLWVATTAHLYQRRRGASKFEAVSTRLVVRTMCADEAGRLWVVGPQQAIARLQDGADDDNLSSWADAGGWRLIRDRYGALWVATLGRGVLRLRFPDSHGTPLIDHWNHEMGLTNDSVRALLEDREGNLWVGTQDGLNRISDTTIVSISNPAVLSQPVRAVTSTADGAVWIGTDNGVYRAVAGGMRHFGRAEGLPSVTVGAIHTDRRGGLWVATDQGGLAEFNASRNRFKPVPLPPEIRRIWAMTSDDEGALWLCEVDLGVFRWVDGALTSFSSDPAIRRKFGTSAFTDRAGRVWIGFSDGTVAVREGSAFHLYTSGDGLPEGSIRAIYQDSGGTLWVGATGGLRMLSGGRFVPLDWASTMPLRNVRAIIEDRERNLWVGASTGLIRVDHHEHTFSVFDSSDGLRGMPMSVGGAPSAAAAGDGTLWFVTSSGIASVDSGHINRSRLPPPVRIETLVVDDRAASVGAHSAASAMRLPPKTSRIEIDYTALSFSAPGRVRFRYMLEGFDTSWIDAGTRRQAFYTNLPPRNYRFRVIAENDGVRNDAGATWDFSIEPTFYQTKWFRSAGVVAVFGAAIVAWQLRVRKVKARFSLVLAERARVAREIHDTLLQSLVGVAFQFDTAFSELDESLPDAKKRLSRLRDQIGTAIREARDSIWELRSTARARPDLMTSLRDTGQRMTGSCLAFSFKMQGDAVRLPGHVEEALLRIATEALSNSVRHASALKVAVELAYTRDAVTLCISDDGRGFETSTPSHAADHWGLLTMRERAAQIHAQFTLRSTEGNGTEIKVVAPIARSRSR